MVSTTLLGGSVVLRSYACDGALAAVWNIQRVSDRVDNRERMSQGIGVATQYAEGHALQRNGVSKVTHESPNGGPGPQGIFTVRPELLVPFAGEWAA